jgi:hypothetical protein
MKTLRDLVISIRQAKLFHKTHTNFKTHTLIMLSQLLNKYIDNDWKLYIENDDEGDCRDSKNGITKINITLTNVSDLFDMYILIFNKNTSTKNHYHNHENICIFKVLQGNLQEKIYDEKTKKYINTLLLSTNSINYSHSKLGIHTLHNNFDDFDNIAIILCITNHPKSS